MDCFFQSISGYNLENQDREQLLQTAQNLLAQAQALSSRIATINELATAINRTLSVDEILRVVGKKAKWLLDFEHLSVYLCLNNHQRFVTLFGSPVEFNDSAFSDNNPFSRALKTSQSQLFQSGENSQEIGYTTTFLSAFSSQLIVPLQSDRIVIGTINFATTKTQAYTHEDVRIGYLLALQVSAAIRNANCFEELNLLYDQLGTEKQKSEQLLLNVLPGEIANELKRNEKVKPVYYESASVLFTDFKNFTKLAEQMNPQDLVDELDYCFSYFDTIVETHNLEKLKTIGDSYMCVGGIPTP
ncbi:MAG TPA: adenylate cyclase, partial [Cyanobacteria bacterium UBA11368]|nr:adenylate cyclase [Cyanobacteria bacterium UBA11368]